MTQKSEQQGKVPPRRRVLGAGAIRGGRNASKVVEVTRAARLAHEHEFGVPVSEKRSRNEK